MLKSIVFIVLLALGLSACNDNYQPDPRIPDLERQRDQAKQESHRWQLVGLVAGLGVVLFVGAGLGASARRKAGGKHERPAS